MPTVDAKSHAFMEAIKEMELSRSVDQLLLLFTADATLDSIAYDEPRTGLADIRTFWEEYLGAFKEVATKFTQVINVNDVAVLEWTSKGTLTNGLPVRYRGATLLEFVDDRVKSFRAYYDSAAFIPEYEKHLKRTSRNPAHSFANP